MRFYNPTLYVAPPRRELTEEERIYVWPFVNACRAIAHTTHAWSYMRFHTPLFWKVYPD